MPLNLREVTAIPNLRAANLKTDSGVELLAVEVGQDSLHIVSADGSLDGLWDLLRGNRQL